MFFIVSYDSPVRVRFPLFPLKKKFYDLLEQSRPGAANRPRPFRANAYAGRRQ